MFDLEANEEIKNSMGNIKSWLTSRAPAENADEVNIIKAHEGLRAIGFADLVLPKLGPEHQEGIVFCHDNSSQKPKAWTELSHLVAWSTELLKLLKDNKPELVTLELMRSPSESTVSLARYRVEEATNFLAGALNFELGLDVQHPDTRGVNYGSWSLLVEESSSVLDIVRQVFTCLFSHCVVCLVVKTNAFFSALLASFLMDLMHKAGASPAEIKCVSFERRESLGNERLNRCSSSSPSPGKSSKLSAVAAVFKQTDTFAAAQGIVESYFREQFPNLIILVEESAYERFVLDWQRYYSHAMFIGPRMDNRTSVLSEVNERLQVELAAIDIKAAHKMSGMAINVLKFRTLAELLSLLANLRKLPFMSIWNDDDLLSRDLCTRINICNDFWLNHIPKSVVARARKVGEDMLNYYAELVADDMANIYNSVYAEFADEAEQLRKVQANFMKKDASLRQRIICQAFVSLISRCKSLKNGATSSEALAKLRRSHFVDQLADSSSQKVEIILRPVGLAIVLVREDNAVKSKAALVEFIFKNFLLGNAVLLVCPANTLGAKFAFEHDHLIPFKMVHDALPDLSRLSLDSSIDSGQLTGGASGDPNDSPSAAPAQSNQKKSCPRNTYAIEVLPEMNSESFQMIAIALGTRRKTILYREADQTNYWASE